MEAAMKHTALVSAAIAVVCAALAALGGPGMVLTAAITAGTVFYHMSVRLLIGCAFDRHMNNRADCTKRWYQPARWEAPLYEKLGVKRWKRRMPTYESGLFDPSLHSWREIAEAMCQAELVHEACAAASFLPLMFSAWFGAASVFLLTSLLAAVYDMMFVALQRYNRPRVLRLAAQESRRQELERSSK